MKKKCRWTWAGRLGWIFGFCGAIWLWAAWLLPTAVSPATVAVSGSRVTEGNCQQKIVRVAYYQEPDWQEGAGEGNEIDGERKFIDESPPQSADSQPMKARRWV